MTETKPNVTKWRQRLNEADHGPKVWVDVPGHTDVLLGKQRDAFNHVGNRKFRTIIHANWERYNNAKGRCERTSIVVSIVKFLIEEKRVRFLKKDRVKQRWFIVHDSVAREKVGHAIRDAINFRRHHDRKMAECSGENEPQQSMTTTTSLSRSAKNKQKQSKQSDTRMSREDVATILGALKKAGAHVRNEIPQTILPSPTKQSASMQEEAAMMGAFSVWASQNFEQLERTH